MDYEHKSSYTVTVTANDGKKSSDPKTVTITVTDVEEAPAFPEAEDGERAVAENAPTGTRVGAPVRAMDSDDDPLEYSIPDQLVTSLKLCRLLDN